MRLRTSLMRHLLSALVLVAMLMLALGTTIIPDIPQLDVQINATKTGLAVRYGADVICELGEVIIRVDSPDGSTLSYMHTVRRMEPDHAVSVEFADFETREGRPFVWGFMENPRVGLSCERPTGLTREFVPLHD